jgi:hypothetical protein
MVEAGGGELVRCPRCGNENPETNRFCGMCGATMLQAPTAAGSGAENPSSAFASSAARPASSSESRGSAASEEAPVISGPSFLGLNEPAPRKSGSLSIDPRGARSRNLDYLLDDEEEPRRGGAGKYVLILIALALAVGLGYLRWKNQGFGWLRSAVHKPAAAQSSETPESGTTQPGSAGTSNSSNATPAQSASQPGAGTPPGGNVTSSSTPASNSPSSGTSASGTSAPAAPAPSTSPSGTSASGTTPSDASAPGTQASRTPAASAAPAPTTPAAGDTADSSSAAANAPSNNAAAPAGADTASTAQKSALAETPSSKPAAAEKPARAADPVSEAQKYLYGKGVPQNCDRGLRLLKPAADQANAKAMIEMGALYSAGLCTPRDLPTAYRWFAMALRKEPDNQSVQTDLQKLWGEMTQPERQLAIRLSQ